MHTHPLIIDLAVAERRARLVGDGPTWGGPTPPGRPRRRLAAPMSVIALALGAAGLMAACDPVPPPLCAGETPTIVGTPGNDRLTGTSGPDVIVGLGGNDTIFGLYGDDVVCGGAGNDVIQGDHGQDLLDGEAGSDQLNGSVDRDHVIDSSSDPRDTNRLAGGPGDDRLSGGAGRDLVVYTQATQAVSVDLGHKSAFGDGTDTLTGTIEGVVGSAFGDTLAGDDRSNGLDGQGGDDVLIGRAGNDNLIGGSEVDRVSYSSSPFGVTVSLATGRATGEGSDVLTGIEDISGSNGGDDLSGDTGPNTIDGGHGADRCTGNGGSDTFIRCP